MADSRKQFTFYRSYYEAIQAIPKRDQAAVLLAICAYALYETEPKLSGTADAIFSLIRPTLDASRRKAESGKRGGGAKQSASKTEANAKQTASEKEKEREKEKEKENECYTPTPFDEFWEAYPKKRSKGDAEKAWKQVKPDKATFRKILHSVEQQKKSKDWQKDGGQYIPYPATWLRAKGWEDETGVNGNGRNAGAGEPAELHGTYL